jgi:hypothetical protein
MGPNYVGSEEYMTNGHNRYAAFNHNILNRI